MCYSSQSTERPIVLKRVVALRSLDVASRFRNEIFPSIQELG